MNSWWRRVAGKST